MSDESQLSFLVRCPHCGHWLWANTHHCPGCCYQFKRGPIEHCLRRTFRHVADLPYVAMGVGIMMLAPYAPKACRMECWPTDTLSMVGVGLIIASGIAGEIITVVNQGRRLFLRGFWPFSLIRNVICGIVTQERRRRNRLRSEPRMAEQTPST
jgi:hypothetical protein